MIAGLAGMLYAPQMRIFTPTNLIPSESILVVIWVAVGGRGTLSGPILGALVVNYGYSYLTSRAPDAWPFALGGSFLAVDPATLDRVVRGVEEAIASVAGALEGTGPVLLVSQTVRSPLRQVLARVNPRLAVLSHSEVPPDNANSQEFLKILQVLIT